MTDLTLPITYRRSARKMVLLFLVSLVFVAGGLAMAQEQPLTGYASAAFFGVCALVGAVSLHPRASYLELTDKGFTTCSLFRRASTPWTDVREFFPLRVQLNSMVGWNYSDRFNRQAGARRFAKALAGAEGMLPDTYGMSAKELAAKLNALLAHATRHQR